MWRPHAIRSLVLLFSRPPYLRWAAAAAILIAAVLWDLSDRATEPLPFAAEPILRGSPISADKVVWRPVPRNTMRSADLAEATALVDIAAGDPLTSSVAGPEPPVPDGWWSVPVELPAGVPVGSAVRLTFLDGSSVEGTVSIAPREDQFGMTSPGAVAVPEAAVDQVAVAEASDTLLVVIAP